jgi:HEPN domain-containing protein
MTPALEEAQRLLRLALRDRDTFELLLPLPQASIAAIGFHAQQVIEKALKAIGTLHGLEVRRTHDLAALAQALIDSGQTLPASIDQFRQLNPFAVEFRYDDEFNVLITRDELSSIVRGVLDWAQALMASTSGSGSV